MKPLKKHYVQCGESMSGCCVTKLLFLNKIRLATTQNNTDNKGRIEGSDGLERLKGGQRKVWYVHVCKLLQVSQESMTLQRLLSSKRGGFRVLVLGAGQGLVGSVIFRLPGVKRGSKHFFLQFSHCPTSLWHAGWPHQSWSCWNQPEREKHSLYVWTNWKSGQFESLKVSRMAILYWHMHQISSISVSNPGISCSAQLHLLCLMLCACEPH